MTTKPTLRLLLFFGLTLAIAAGAAGGIKNTDDQAVATPTDSLSLEQQIALAEQLRLDSIARQDSILLAFTDSLNNVAANLYKNLKFIRYDGITEKELYPRVMSTYNATLDAVAAPRSTEADTIRHRAVLIDLAPLLMQGAIYYSGLQMDTEFHQFARNYVDLRRNPMMNPSDFVRENPEIYASLIYASAALTYNSGDQETAAEYLMMYVETGDKSHRENVIMFLGQAALNTGQSARFIDVLLKGADEYPGNYPLLLITLQNALDAGETTRIDMLADKALLLHSDDQQLLWLRGRLFEREGNYADALGYFEQLVSRNPDSLTYFRHLAICYYNLGVSYYNKSIMEPKEKLSQRYMRQSTAYFTTAADKLQRLVDNDPDNITYLKTLAMTYACLGRKENLEEINLRLMSVGQSTIRLNDMPVSLIAEGAPQKSGGFTAEEIPGFQSFAKESVTLKLKEWSSRGEFEKIEDYTKRVTEETLKEQHKVLSKEAEKLYLDKYARRFRISDMKLLPYDTENECFKIQSSMGDFVVNVPSKKHEAEAFKSEWETIQIRNPKYIIQNDQPAIAEITLATSSGKSYTYTSDMAANYDYTRVIIDGDIMAGSNTGGVGGSTVFIRAKSDVDENIPITSRVAGNTVALVIANENYNKASNVESALQDGETVSEYFKRTLGIPEHQVIYRPDVTYANMIEAVSHTRSMVSTIGNNVDLIVYYAGHGFPDEESKDAYLLPVDGNGLSTTTAYSLNRFYSDLADSGAENVMVFVDACFSGATRNGNMLVDARGVALKAKSAAPAGNMFILSATSEAETAMPYKDKHHGLFTYYFLKKLQSSKGNVSLKDLTEYVKDNVSRTSLQVNKKKQTPNVIVSGSLKNTWHDKKLRP